ncbi:hypothetical protein LMG1860_00430 [Achromobacter denitrificans]|nr:hypothetical protein LMG1860_00430 [Achromobacter denitrificans]
MDDATYMRLACAAKAKIEKLESQRDRALAQLRECADTLGADQIDEMRASRAYADAMALLEEMPHISRTPAGNAPLKEQS